MSYRASAFTRHRQSGWMRPDAARWVRPDAARFLRPGTDPADVYPALAQQQDALQRKADRALADAIVQERAALVALRQGLVEINAALALRRAERKYSDSQPRVPAGNSDGGQWTSGSSGRPRVYITRTNPDDDIGDAGIGDGGFGIDVGNVLGNVLGDIADGIDKLDLFDVKPPKPRRGGMRLAGDLPRGMGDNGGPPLGEPPEIPKRMPDTVKKRMGFVRGAAKWIARAGRRALVVDIFFGALDQADDLKRLTEMIKIANDPPRMLNELQEQIGKPGYQRHHIAEEAAARDVDDPESLIQGINNLAGVPTLKHIDITAEYNRKVEQPDGRMRSPRELLKEADFETRRQYGLDVMRRHGVMK